MPKSPRATQRITLVCLSLSLTACGSSVVPSGDAGSAEDGATLTPDATLVDASTDAARDASRPDASRPDASMTPDAGTPPDPPSVRFVAMGDGGEGNDAQYLVGHSVAEVCAADGCDFVLYLGDNFYDTGVSGVDDPQWQTKFELPYAELTDLGVPFYVVLGNHDYGGDGAGIEVWKGAHQIDYSARSATWTMPDEYYTFVREHVTFVGLDTNAIFWGVGLGQQKSWVDDTLLAATTPWRIVFGHHPYISNGKHGNAGNYEGLPSWVPIASGVNVRRFFDESLCNGPVDVYISGHDHNRQWLPEQCGIQHFVSGAAAKTTGLEGRGNVTSFEDDSEPGFLYVEISGDTLRGRFHGEDGRVQFEQTMTRPSVGTR
jgi:tartrate-resistant acid phosphatase type 5